MPGETVRFPGQFFVFPNCLLRINRVFIALPLAKALLHNQKLATSEDFS